MRGQIHVGNSLKILPINPSQLLTFAQFIFFKLCQINNNPQFSYWKMERFVMELLSEQSALLQVKFVLIPV